MLASARCILRDMKVVVAVKPNSKKGTFVMPHANGSLVVYVKEVAADGEAAIVIKNTFLTMSPPVQLAQFAAS